MPNNKVHHSYWKIFFPLAVLLSVAVGVVMWDIYAGLLVFAGYLLGAICDPDLDQISITGAEGRAMRQFGLLGVLYSAYWMPYAYLIPHRSWVSHSIGISTAIRLIYLMLIPLGVATYLGVVYMDDTTMTLLIYIFGYVWMGLTLADSVHIILDKRRK